MLKEHLATIRDGLRKPCPVLGSLHLSGSGSGPWASPWVWNVGCTHTLPGWQRSSLGLPVMDTTRPLHGEQLEACCCTGAWSSASTLLRSRGGDGNLRCRGPSEVLTLLCCAHRHLRAEGSLWLWLRTTAGCSSTVLMTVLVGATWSCRSSGHSMVKGWHLFCRLLIQCQTLVFYFSVI